MKISHYANAHYCLSFGREDTVFLDMEIEITEQTSGHKDFLVKIVKTQLDPTQEEFPVYLLKFLTAEQLEQVRQEIESRLLSEIQPSLFSLYYAGDLQQSPT